MLGNLPCYLWHSFSLGVSCSESGALTRKQGEMKTCYTFLRGQNLFVLWIDHFTC